MLSYFRFHPLIVGLIIGTSLSRGFTLMCMPFLAFHLSIDLQLDPVSIGMILGLGPLFLTMFAFFSGLLSDKLGRQKIMLMGLCGTTLVFLGFGLATTAWQFAILNIFNGIFIACFTPAASALFSDLIQPNERIKAFHLRYYGVNLAAAIAPILGTQLFLMDHKVGFFLTSGIFFLYIVFLGFLFYFFPVSEKENSQINLLEHFRHTWSTFRQDKIFIIFTITLLMIEAAYSQFDSLIPQILNVMMAQEGIWLFGWMSSLNALTVLLFQPLFLIILRRYSLFVPLILGCFAFSMAFFGFCLISPHHFTWLLSSIILTVGEVLIYSYANIIVDSLAPIHLKGAYFGAAELGKIGLAIGPLMGGFLFQTMGGRACLLVFSLLCFAIGMIHMKWTAYRLTTS